PFYQHSNHKNEYAYTLYVQSVRNIISIRDYDFVDFVLINPMLNIDEKTEFCLIGQQVPKRNS
ncbi:MAG: hypothetical protein L0G67_08105, partial [Acinetobacter sp.]|nr:hypothetical protein [Acinetobacter sp.]